MPLYHLHEGVVSVPDGWRDQTMNVFRLPGANSNKDAALIVTRDYDTPIESPAEYADSQQEAAKKTFPGYKQIDRQELTIDGQSAAVVDYQWRSNGSVMLRQRQVYVRHQGAMLTLTASAMANEFDRIDAIWEPLLASFKLIERETEVAVADEPTTATQDVLPHVFALSTRDRRLLVFTDSQDACRQVDALDVEDDAWVFFAGNGTPLKAKFITRNRRGLLRAERGTFELHPDTVGVSLPLQKRLAGVTSIQGVQPFETLDSVSDYLQSLAPAGQPA